MLHWIHRNQFLEEVSNLGGLPGQPQLIVLRIDTTQFRRDVPTEGSDSELDESMAGPAIRWYGKFNSHLFTFDVPISAPYLDRCMLTTPFPNDDDYDWSTLVSLGALIEFCDVHHVAFIESRAVSPTHSVYYFDDRGFDVPVYDASSIEESESLVAWMESFRIDGHYYSGIVEAEADWRIVECNPHSTAVLGRYSSRSASIDVACRMSMNSQHVLFVVNESPEGDLRPVEVANGRVIVGEKKGTQLFD